MDAVDMLRLMFDVELRLLAVGRFSRRTGWREGVQLYQINCGLAVMAVDVNLPREAWRYSDLEYKNNKPNYVDTVGGCD